MQPTAASIASQFPALAVHLSPRGLELLARNVTVVNHGKGHKLLEYGAHSKAMYLIAAGKLSVSVGKPEHALTLGVVGPGRWVGELGAIEPGPSSGNVVAQEDVTLYALDAPTLEAMEKEDPAAAGGLLQAIALNISERIRVFSAGFLRDSQNGSLVFEKVEQKKRNRVSWLFSHLFGMSETNS